VSVRHATNGVAAAHASTRSLPGDRPRAYEEGACLAAARRIRAANPIHAADPLPLANPVHPADPIHATPPRAVGRAP
jgi:hypothetical protein